MKIQIGEDSDGDPVYDEVENVSFSTEEEEWNEYKLEDDTTVKIKVVVGKILRSKEKTTDTGEPLYHVQSQTIVSANVPEKLIEDSPE